MQNLEVMNHFFILHGVALPVCLTIFSLFVGGVVGWCLAMKTFKKQLKDNPPITDQNIKDLYKQIGRKPTEKQIKQIMANFKK